MKNYLFNIVSYLNPFIAIAICVNLASCIISGAPLVDFNYILLPSLCIAIVEVICLLVIFFKWVKKTLDNDDGM